MDLTKFRANQRIKVVDSTNKINGQTINDFFIIKELIWEFGEQGGQFRTGIIGALDIGTF